MSANREDIKSLLKTADLLVRNGMIADALQCYDRAAAMLMASDAVMKAVAVSKQIVTLIDASHPELRSQYKHVWLRLADGYARLGLLAEEQQARKRCAEVGQ